MRALSYVKKQGIVQKDETNFFYKSENNASRLNAILRIFRLENKILIESRYPSKYTLSSQKSPNKNYA